MSINFYDHNISTSGTFTASSGNFTTLVVNGTSVSDFNSSVSGLLPTISNSGDNRILTSDGTSTGINAESNLTFNNNTLTIGSTAATTLTINASSSGSDGPVIFGKADNANEWLICSQRGLVGNGALGLGLYVYNAYPMSFWTNNSERMRITSDGNVGIGTSTPAHKLEIVKSSPSSLGAIARLYHGPSSDRSFEIGVHETTPFPVYIQARNTGSSPNDLSIQPYGGNVGIGTSSPSNKLHIQGGELYKTTTDFAFGTTGSIITLYHGTSTGNTYSAIGALSAGASAWNNLVLQAGGGNVGIGTSSPATRLHVAGTSSTFNGLLLTTTAAGGGVYTSIETGAYYPSWTVASPASLRFIDDGNFSSHITFRTKTSGSSSNSDVERLRIASDGIATFSNYVFAWNYLRLGEIYGSMGLYIGSTYNMRFDLGWDGDWYFSRGGNIRFNINHTGSTWIKSTRAWNDSVPTLNIGNDGDGRLQTRHIWGKSSGGAGAEHLWLQLGNPYHVQVGNVGQNTNLYVGQDLAVGAYFSGGTAGITGSNGYIYGKRFYNIDSVGTDTGFGLYFNGSSETAYAIYRESGTWSSPFPDLRIAFHTGIKIGANATYNGVRFYTDYDMSSQVMSVNNGSDGLGAGNVFVNNSLQVDNQIVINRNIATPANYWNGLQMEIRATSGTAGIGLHRYGYSHVGIYIDSANQLKFNMGAGTPVLEWNAGTILGTGNYNSYAPTLTGGGASGTWGINVTGTAGSISGFNNPTTAATANTIMYRDGNADTNIRYLFSQYVNMSHATATRSSDTVFYSSTDDYIRKTNATGMRAALNVPTRTGGDASGTWGINVTGSAGSLTAGDKTISGVLTVTSGGFSYITMGDSDEGNRQIHCNSNRIGFLNQSGAWGSWCEDDGAWATDFAVYAPIFYDRNNTAYYLDPASTSVLNRVNPVGWDTSGRNYSREWIEFPNHSALYSPLNGAHFYPNNLSYGAWRIAGTRNGWGGLEFDSTGAGQISLMMNSNFTGVHNNTYGWQWYWTGGKFYVSTGTYGGGTILPVILPGDNGSVKAWCRFDGTAASPIPIAKGYNVTNITRLSTGSYQVNLSISIGNADYCAVASATVASSRVTGVNNTQVFVDCLTSGGSFVNAAQVHVVLT